MGPTTPGVGRGDVMAKRRPTGRKPGRPRVDLTDEQLVQLADLTALGLTQWEACDHMGIADRTLRHRLRDDPRVAAAIAKGKAMLAESVSRALVKKAKAGHLGHIVWFEKTRRGLSDRVAVEHSGKLGIDAIEAWLEERESEP